jgi:hypothetical protein
MQHRFSLSGASARREPRRPSGQVPGPAGVPPKRTLVFDMQVIVRRQDQEHCASITCMIRHYVARRAQVTEGHPHNAEERVLDGRMFMRPFA